MESGPSESASGPPRPCILVADDDDAIRHGIKRFFESKSYEVVEARSVQEATRALQMSAIEAAIVDLRMQDGTAVDFLTFLREQNLDVPTIILTGFGTIEDAVTAMKAGAEQFLTKPVELSTLSSLVVRQLEARQLRFRKEASERSVREGPVDPFLGATPSIRQLREVVGRLSRTRSPILILGETGTGKTRLARWIHEHSSRGSAAFVEINCASLPRDLMESELFGHERGSFTGAVGTKRGLFEVAHGGTLFLDEIGDLSLDLQPRLLKLVEDRTFRRLGGVQDRVSDVRIIAATHQDLHTKVRAGHFRQDLLFRINTFTLNLPALRHRPQDIGTLAQGILNDLAADFGVPPRRLAEPEVATLQSQPWPGNFRELRNTLERSLLLGGIGIEPSKPEALALGPAQGLTLEAAERAYVTRVVAESGGDVDMAARTLGISRSAVYKRLKRARSERSGGAAEAD